jgi:hypothetical protein
VAGKVFSFNQRPEIAWGGRRCGVCGVILGEDFLDSEKIPA